MKEDKTPDQIELTFSQITELRKAPGFIALLEDTRVRMGEDLEKLKSGVKQGVRVDGKPQLVPLTDIETWYIRGCISSYEWFLSFVENAYQNESERLREHGNSND